MHIESPDSNTVDERAGLSRDERDVILEEEALLANAQAAITRERERRAGAKVGDLRSVESLRALRAEAEKAPVEDLPALLHEMSVRQRLLERTTDPLPDPQLPYLSHLRVREGGTSKDYLLGQVSLIDTDAGVRIVDWRVAPVARIFYRYREGDEYEEEFPGRVAEGVVEARRILVIDRGRLCRVVGDGVLLTRTAEGWKSDARDALALAEGGHGHAARPGILGVGAGDRGRIRTDVTSLLDREQFDAITSPREEPLLVLGSAGSGKTTVALHRLTHALADQSAEELLESARVVVPEEGLARLSRRLLGPLGVPGSVVQTLDDWAIQSATAAFGPLPRLSDAAPGLVTSLKRHPALFRALREHFKNLAPEATTTLPKLRKRLGEVLTDHEFLERVVSLADGSLSRAVIHETVRYTMLQLSDSFDRELRSISKDRRRAIDGRKVTEGTPDELAGTLDAEDLPILLFLKAWRGAERPRWLTHLVLDEAEDFSLFESFVLGTALKRNSSVTLAGDEAQVTASSFSGWPGMVSALGVKGMRIVRLGVSYRCPRPVTELARDVLGALAPVAQTAAARDGSPVGLFHFPTTGQAALFVAGAVADLADREPEASIAVVAHDVEAARALYPFVAERNPSATRLVLDGDDVTFDPGIDVTHVDAVKGLEFDYVVVPDATQAAYPAVDESRRRLHVAVTRAAHQLWLVAGGRPTPLVRFE